MGGDPIDFVRLRGPEWCIALTGDLIDHSLAGIPLTHGGHTHGGQIMLNPALGAGPLMYRYWFPLRTAAPAEIHHLTLRRA
jgi:hypothetical protein